MTVIKTTALALMALLISATVVAGHHEKGEGPMLAAKPGQIMIVYYWPCADADTGLTLIKEMIAYERDASPHPYSAAPAIHSDCLITASCLPGSHFPRSTNLQRFRKI